MAKVLGMFKETPKYFETYVYCNQLNITYIGRLVNCLTVMDRSLQLKTNVVFAVEKSHRSQWPMPYVYQLNNSMLRDCYQN